MVIYVDEMFLENFIMNYLIVYMTSYFSKVKTRWYRIATASSVGAIYVIASYILDIKIYQEFACKVGLSFFIVLIGFNIKGIKEFLKISAVFYLITFVIGGASFGLSYLLNIKGNMYEGVMYIDEFPLQMIVISVFTVFILLKIISIFLKNRIRFDSIIFPIEISVNKRKIKIDAFLDTGNNVKEPYTNREVIFTELEAIKSLVPYNIYEVLKNCDEIDKITDNYWKTRLRIVPFSTVGHDNQVFLGFRPDKVVICTNEGRIERNDVIVAVCERELSKEKNYSALIGSDLVKNEMMKV